MLKYLLLSFPLFFIGFYSGNNHSTKADYCVSTNSSQHKNVINVYLITWLCNGELSETQYSGEYDDVANKLRVEKELFDVKDNPLYGTKGDLRGRYKFVAGSYYFNKN